jgi:hypothetical protein
LVLPIAKLSVIYIVLSAITYLTVKCEDLEVTSDASEAAVFMLRSRCRSAIAKTIVIRVTDINAFATEIIVNS